MSDDSITTRIESWSPRSISCATASSPTPATRTRSKPIRSGCETLRSNSTAAGTCSGSGARCATPAPTPTRLTSVTPTRSSATGSSPGAQPISPGPLTTLSRWEVRRLARSPKTKRGTMELDGIHHITCITADAPGNVDFYARVLGLRLVKKTVNFDAPDVYHLYYGDERGAPGSILTFFEFPDAARGRAGAGMIHRLRWRVGSSDALAFWSDRLAAEGVEVERDSVAEAILFKDPEGLDLELTAVPNDDEPLRARAPDIPPEHALLGFDGVRAYGTVDQPEDRLLIEAMGFETHGARGVLDPGPPRGDLHLRRPAGGGRIPGRRHRPSHRLVRPRRRARSLARPGREIRPAPDAGDRPPVLPQHLLPGRRAGCCSSSPRRAPASRSTRTRPISARRSGCLPSTSTCESSSSRRSRP